MSACPIVLFFAGGVASAPNATYHPRTRVLPTPRWSLMLLPIGRSRNIKGVPVAATTTPQPKGTQP